LEPFFYLRVFDDGLDCTSLHFLDQVLQFLGRSGQPGCQRNTPQFFAFTQKANIRHLMPPCLYSLVSGQKITDKPMQLVATAVEPPFAVGPMAHTVG